jgi:hypothetical protein
MIDEVTSMLDMPKINSNILLLLSAYYLTIL